MNQWLPLASDNAYYVFEPLQLMKINGTSIEELISKNDHKANEKAKKRLLDLFNCDYQHKLLPVSIHFSKWKVVFVLCLEYQ